MQETKTETETERTPLTSRGPQPGEMALIGGQFGCIIRCIGPVNGHVWVETSASPYGVVQGVLHDWGRTRMWAVRPYSG